MLNSFSKVEIRLWGGQSMADSVFLSWYIFTILAVQYLALKCQSMSSVVIRSLTPWAKNAPCFLLTSSIYIYTYIDKDLNQNLQIWIHLSIRPVATDFLCNLADLRFFILIPSMSSTRITWCARCISMSCVRYCTPYRDISRFWQKVVWNYTKNYSFSVNLNCFIIRFNWGIENKCVLWQTFRKTCPKVWRKKTWKILRNTGELYWSSPNYK